METQELTLHNELKRKSIFLRDYTTELYASGATTIRIEKNLGRIAEQWHTKADFSVLPTCIVLNLWDENKEKSYTVTGKIPADRINFNTVSDLSISAGRWSKRIWMSVRPRPGSVMFLKRNASTLGLCLCLWDLPTHHSASCSEGT